MFRLLYLVVFAVGLLWIVESRPLWLDPQRAADMRPAADGDWEHQEIARAAETRRRVKLVVLAVMGVVVAGEVWVLLYHRLRLFHRT
jgi:hypothetical protein